MKYIDLFAGIGGFRLGIKNAHSDWKCVYSNEWDKYANSVYRKHYGECDNRDIRTVKASEIPDHDLLVGGFPCQSFSVAGKRGGFNDTRGTLFFEIARIAHEKQPRLLLLENVKGLLNHDSGRTFATILFSLDELGYDAQWQVLNSKDFGVPQNRERVFIIGHLRGTSRPKVFPLSQDGNPLTKKNGRQISQSSISGTLTATDAKMHLDGTYINQINQPKHSNDRIYGDDGNGTQIRRLTPVECERLQGFEDNWTEFGANGEKISDTQRYKMCGNAVTTNVVTEIVKKLAGRTE